MPLCSVPGCIVNGVHLFPQNAELKKQWETVIRRKNFVATENSRLCRNHFKDSDYVGVSASTGQLLKRRVLKKGTIPSIFPRMKSNSPSTSNRAQRYRRRIRRQLDYTLNSGKNTSYLNVPDIVDGEIVLSGTSPVKEGLEESIKSVPSIFPWKKSNSPSTSNRAQHYQRRTRRQLDYTLNSDKNTSYLNVPDIVGEEIVLSGTSPVKEDLEESVKTTATQTNVKQHWFSIETIKKDPKMIHYYTGIETYAKFRLVLSTLSPMCYDLTYRKSKVVNVSIEDQLLITLIKLRCNKPDIEISFMFQISESNVSNIFVTWTNFMSYVWSHVDVWPSKNLVQYYMPEQFKKDFLTTRIIIDTTEFPICKPSNPVAQQATFSTYKNRNTLKVMVGSTPGGLISYISQGYGGSVSDRQIIERSDLLHKCDDGDSIMADKGFNVQDIVAPKNV